MEELAALFHGPVRWQRMVYERLRSGWPLGRGIGLYMYGRLRASNHQSLAIKPLYVLLENKVLLDWFNETSPQRGTGALCSGRSGDQS
jgi:hypothetical protein